MSTLSGESAFAPQVALIAVFVAELLYLTVTFDTQNLEKVPSVWAQFVGWAPQYLRLAITVTMMTALMGNRQLLTSVRDLHRRAERTSSLPSFAVHCCALFVFIQVTAIVMGGDFSQSTHPVSWILAWFLTGIAALVAWGLALFPAQIWLVAARKGRATVCAGLAIGTAVWGSGFLTEQLWTSLARYTFNVVAWMLHFIDQETINDPAKLAIGTPSFRVIISPQCSGYEGVGLILAFLTVYLWVFRRDLRFPHALAILPIGAAAIWIINALRIVALIVIGTSGWPAIAKGGFHSQAGWLAFNAVALGFVAVTIRGRYFTVAAAPGNERDPTTAYLAPFVAITATAMLTGAFSGGFDWLYPVRVVTAGTVLWAFRKSYANLQWTLSWWAVAIGFVTFLVWLALMPAAVSDKDGWPAALRSISWYWAAAWMLFRLVGYVVTVPLTEELAFRGFLTRRIVRADFQKLPVGMFTWSSFLVSSALFGAFHGGMWLGGTIAGMSFALALYHRRALGDAVQAHATTNGLLALYAFATGRWSVWS